MRKKASTIKKAKVKRNQARRKNKVKNKRVCYAYLSTENMKYLKDLGATKHRSVSYCLDKIVDGFRTGDEVDIPKNKLLILKKKIEAEENAASNN